MTITRHSRPDRESRPFGKRQRGRAYNLRIKEIIPRVPSAFDEGYYTNSALKYVLKRQSENELGQEIELADD